MSGDHSWTWELALLMRDTCSLNEPSAQLDFEFEDLKLSDGSTVSVARWQLDELLQPQPPHSYPLLAVFAAADAEPADWLDERLLLYSGEARLLYPGIGSGLHYCVNNIKIRKTQA